MTIKPKKKYTTRKETLERKVQKQKDKQGHREAFMGDCADEYL